MRVVLDSSILVRAYVSSSGPAARLIRTLTPPKHRIVISQFIVDEVSRVLSYPRIGGKYGVAIDQIERRLHLLVEGSDWITPEIGDPIILTDPDDDPVLYTAVSGKAGVLCTLDRHFEAPHVLAFCAHHRIRVLKDVQLLTELLLDDAAAGQSA
jgi:putative PIN family toxin of toxin-antitoxin system